MLCHAHSQCQCKNKHVAPNSDVTTEPSHWHRRNPNLAEASPLTSSWPSNDLSPKARGVNANAAALIQESQRHIALQA